MANHKHLHGTDILLMYKDADTGNYRTIAGARTAGLEIEVDTQEVSSPLTGTWKTYITKRKSWSMSTSGLLSSNSDLLWQLFNKGDELVVTWRDRSKYIYNDRGAGEPEETGNGYEYSGSAIIKSLKVTGTFREFCQYSIELDGTGELTCQRWSTKRDVKIYPFFTYVTEPTPRWYLKKVEVYPPVPDALTLSTNLTLVTETDATLTLDAFTDVFTNTHANRYYISDYNDATFSCTDAKYNVIIEESQA